MTKSFSEQIAWSAGTPVLVVGYRTTPYFVSSLVNNARVAALGRLSERWKPGQALLMDEGPMSLNMPAVPEAATSLIVGGDAPSGLDVAESEEHILRRWKKGFSIDLRHQLSDGGRRVYYLGCRHYRIFEDVTGMAKILPEKHVGGDWAGKLKAVHEVINHVAWRHGSEYHGWHYVRLNAATLELERA